MYSSTKYLSPKYPIPPASSWEDLGGINTPYSSYNLQSVPLQNAPLSTVWGVQEIDKWYRENEEPRDGEQPLASALYKREQPWHTESWNEDWCPRGARVFVKKRRWARPEPSYDEDNPHPWTGDQVFGPESSRPYQPPDRRYMGPDPIVANLFGIRHAPNVPITDLRRAAPEPGPRIRVEEYYQYDKWRPVVPVDYKGLVKLPDQARKEQIDGVQATLENWQPSPIGAVHSGSLLPSRRTSDYDCPIS